MHAAAVLVPCAVDKVKATCKQFVVLTRDGRGALPVLNAYDWGK